MIFKQLLKEQFYNTDQIWILPLDMKYEWAGRRWLTSFKHVMHAINKISTKTSLMQDAFKYCILNPWSGEDILAA